MNELEQAIADLIKRFGIQAVRTAVIAWEIQQRLADRHTDCGRPKGSPYEGQD